MRRIPLALTLVRAMLAPLVLAAAFWFPSQPIFIGCLVAALLTDYFDGAIARRLGVATPGLRRLDSIADSLFYACATLAVFHLYPQAILDHVGAFAVLIIIEAARYAYDFRKFGREASYHMWSSKVWGVFLFVGFLSVLGYGRVGGAVVLAIYWGILTDLEGLAISATLHTWRSDVPTLWHARKMAAADA